MINFPLTYTIEHNNYYYEFNENKFNESTNNTTTLRHFNPINVHFITKIKGNYPRTCSPACCKAVRTVLHFCEISSRWRLDETVSLTFWTKRSAVSLSLSFAMSNRFGAVGSRFLFTYTNSHVHGRKYESSMSIVS